jgi:hypothetical protein
MYVRPRDVDVKCGRGKNCFKHPGNSLLRVMVAYKLEEYRKQPTRPLKSKVVNSIISQLDAEGARFLELDRHVGLWYDGGIKAAKQRVGSAFRDANQPNKVKCMEMLKAKIHENNMNGSILNCLVTVIGMRRDDGGSCSSPSQVSGGDYGDVVTFAPILTKGGPTEMNDARWHSAFSHQRLDARFEYTHPSTASLCILNAASNEFQLLSDAYDNKETQASIKHVESFSLWENPDCDDDNSSGTVIEDMDDMSDFEETQASIEHVESFSLRQDPDCDDDNSSGMVIEDKDDMSDDDETQASIEHVESFSLWQYPDCFDDNSSGMVNEDMDDIDDIWNEDFDGDPKHFTRTDKEFLAALDWTKLASIIV